MTKKTILIIIAFFLIFKLDAEEDKILKQNEEVINSSQKIIIEINNIEINSESTDKISFRVNDDEKLRVKQIAPEQGEKLFRFLKKNMENEWTSASKLFEKTNTTEYLSLSTGYIPNWGSIQIRLVESVDLEFFVQPYLVADDSVFLQIKVRNAVKETYFSSSLLPQEDTYSFSFTSTVKNNTSYGLWVINSSKEKSIHLLVFFTAKIIVEENNTVGG